MPEHPPEQHEGNQEGRAAPGADELEPEACFLIHVSLLSDRFRSMADSSRRLITTSLDAEM
jgi:hypothetical protein